LRIETKSFLSFAVALVALSGPGLSFNHEAPDYQKRPIMVADAIQMTRIAGSGYPGFHPKTEFSKFSPDGRQFAFVISKGNIESNTNDFSLLLFRTADLSRGQVPRILASFSSSSNREGIFDLSWSKDNDTLFFLGARADEPAQLYSIKCSPGKLRRLTNHVTSLVSYAVSENTQRIVYAAERPEVSLINANVSRKGTDVTTESLSDLLRERSWNYEPELFLSGNDAVATKRLSTQDPFDSGVYDLSVSPDARYLVVKTDAKEVPESWSQYEDPSIQAVFRRRLVKGFPTRILRYELIDTRAGSSEVLLDSPTTYASSDVMWSPDSKSLLLCGVFLPLNVADPIELRSRKSTKFVVEVTLATRRVTKITTEDLEPIRWNRQTNIVQFRATLDGGQSGSAVYYKKSGTAWERLGADYRASSDARPEITVDEDLNLPPRIVATDSKTKQKTVLLDLNPQFADLALGEVREVTWTDGIDHPVSGGLYLPPDYQAGKRYPLVIQTHGFDPHGFWLDGPYATAFAARPLAAKGIAVLQVNDIFPDSLVTPQEPERAMSTYEHAVELLDENGIIDRNKVGLIGFSRTCLYVKYTLTHSRQRFAAAITADGVDAGYLQYLIFSNANPYASSEFETIIGAPPFGDGLKLWLTRSPGFMLDRVQTPVQLQALAAPSLLGEWEWFSGLRRLNKPVDLVYLPTGTHILVKPWERLVSQGGAVDWFCFWLKGEEDPDPAKVEQYARWRTLRKLSQLVPDTQARPLEPDLDMRDRR
jgi:dipeptidyl aminopeptidase/acylaminoacyl peptidase